MNEKSWEIMMKENLETSVVCHRAADLVTYLYGEASPREASDFELHMEHCGSCRNELKAFTHVRKDVVQWRDQSLPFFDSTHQSTPLPANERARRSSALMALREFFILSPIWMRAATATAAAIVCALLVFTIAYFSEQPRTVVQVVPGEPTQAQVDERVRQRLEELRRQEKQQEAAAPLPLKDSGAVVQEKGASAPVRGQTAVNSSKAVARKQKRETPTRSAGSQEARQELAELVQTQKEEDALPRLSDLIDDANDSN
jgi:hypothetical protein